MKNIQYAAGVMLSWVAIIFLSSFDSHAYTQHGKASYYWQPQKLASGGNFNPQAMTAAHKTLPFGTKIRVTHTSTGRSVVVTINDRGPYIKGRIVDLSLKAATSLGIRKAGVAPVKLEVLGKGSYKSLAKKTKSKTKPKKLAKKKDKSTKKKATKIAAVKSTGKKNKTKSVAAKSTSKKKKSQAAKNVQTQPASQPTTNTTLNIEELIHTG